MHLCVIRHAHAVDAAEDPARPLSPRGRAQVRALAKFLRRTAALEVAEIWHSPLARARETAQGLAKALKPSAPLVEVGLLAGGDDPRPIAARIAKLRRPVALVGHEPQLSALVALLVAGRAAPPAVTLKKGAALRLDRAGGRWAVRWLVAPEILP